MRDKRLVLLSAPTTGPHPFLQFPCSLEASSGDLGHAVRGGGRVVVMSGWWQTVLGVLAGLVLVYLVLLALLWRYARRHPDTVSGRDALRLLPDLVRLLRRLAADQRLPTGVRVRLVLLLVYLASPIDLVPDLSAGVRLCRRRGGGGLGAALSGPTGRSGGPEAALARYPAGPERDRAARRAHGDVAPVLPPLLATLVLAGDEPAVGDHQRHGAGPLDTPAQRGGCAVSG